VTKIPIYKPLLNGNEKKYINECLETNWISSKGKFVPKFENQFASYLNIKYASTVSNGTCALHLALLALGIKNGDEVIVPTLTYIATVNSVTYTGATPIFVDSLPNTWQIDPVAIEKNITKKTKAIIVVHLYGHPCDMKKISAIAKKYNLFVLEDCAEALGSKFKNKHVGTFGDIATYSFYGNKTITTGEGGMVVTKCQKLYKIVQKLKGQGVSKNREYWHDTIGYNYRMTNICAAIGLAQLEQIESIIEKKRTIAKQYEEFFKNSSVTFHSEEKNCFHSYWMYSILLPSQNEKILVREKLQNAGIETRPLFSPIHTMPMYNTKQYLPVAQNLSERGINLPSWPGLTKKQIEYICLNIISYKKHIVFYGKTFCYSGGGIFFLSSIAKALKQTNEFKKLKFSLLLPKELSPTPIKKVRNILGIIKRFLLQKIGTKKTQTFVAPKILIKNLKKIIPNISIVFYKNTEKGLREILKKINADIMLPLMDAPKIKLPCPWIGGIYDFQYKYFPKFFPNMDFSKRDKSVKIMLEKASTMIVVSKNTQNDIATFFPSHDCKVFPLPFLAHSEEEWFINNFQKVAPKYHLPKKYFLISNQFWIHKSHIVAFKALKKLHKTDPFRDIHIVCTGIMHDPRFPNHFSELKIKISELALEKHIHFLGYIPLHAQIQIMRNSLAVLQPTLFEGGPGGGSSYKAIATGIPLIISNIPVNLELKNEAKNIFFFKTNSSNDMANKMRLCLEKKLIKQEKDTLLSEGNIRLKNAGQILLKAINFAVKSQERSCPKK
jgi:perosamine synthetase